MSFINWVSRVIENDTTKFPENCLGEIVTRQTGYVIESEATIGGTGAQAVNVLQLTGSVIITNQWAILTEVTTLTNLTDMYATLWDGTNSVTLTAIAGVSLSGAPVGTIFTKDKTSASVYTVNKADECRMAENISDKNVGLPFIITQKNGADTFIRLHYSTTDNPVNFKAKIHFEYIPLNDSTLAFL